MDFVFSDITAQVVVLGLTMAVVEVLKTYVRFPKSLLWIPVLGLSVGFNYLLGIIGFDVLTMVDAVKLGFVTSGLYGLSKPIIEAINETSEQI